MKQEDWFEEFRNVELNQIRTMFKTQVIKVRCQLPVCSARLAASFFLLCTEV